jgi:hypothetical protein
MIFGLERFSAGAQESSQSNKFRSTHEKQRAQRMKIADGIIVLLEGSYLGRLNEI